MRFPIRVNKFWSPVFRVFGASPDNSFLDVDADSGILHVKMGIWFDEKLPLKEIDQLERSSWPWWGGLGVKLGPRDSIGVVGTSERVVAITFKRPQPMHVIVAVQRPRLLVSPDDPDGFMRAVREALARSDGPAARVAQA